MLLTYSLDYSASLAFLVKHHYWLTVSLLLVNWLCLYMVLRPFNWFNRMDQWTIWLRFKYVRCFFINWVRAKRSNPDLCVLRILWLSPGIPPGLHGRYFLVESPLANSYLLSICLVPSTVAAIIIPLTSNTTSCVLREPKDETQTKRQHWSSKKMILISKL